MTTANYVQIPPQSSGLKIDTSEITTDAGNVVERQNVVLADPNYPDRLTSITADGALAVSETHTVLLESLVAQMKRVARLLEILTNTEITISDAD